MRTPVPSPPYTLRTLSLRDFPLFQMDFSALARGVFRYGTFVTFALRSRPSWRGPMSMTGVPKLAASMMPDELLPTRTAASCRRRRKSGRAMLWWVVTRLSLEASCQHRAMPRLPGSLLGWMMTIRSKGILRTALRISWARRYSDFSLDSMGCRTTRKPLPSRFSFRFFSLVRYSGRGLG